LKAVTILFFLAGERQNEQFNGTIADINSIVGLLNAASRVNNETCGNMIINNAITFIHIE